MASGGKHQSVFSYAIARPFPFRWFTPGAVLGGITFIALFTFLNFASSGYDLIVQTSSSPNDTISQGNWLKHWPSFLTTKVQPTCQPADLRVNSQFFTNHTGLKYTLTSVWRHHASSGAQLISPSLTYNNNVLQNCSITSVEIDLAALDRSGSQFAYSEWGALMRSYASCQIVSATGLVFFNLTQTYEYVPDTVSFADIDNFLGTGFLSRDPKARASLWWGESLMSTYWGAVTWLMQEERSNKTNFDEAGIRKGTVLFTPNGSFSDIKDLNFFNVDYRFIVDRGGGAYDVVCCPDLKTPLTVGALNAANVYPNIWIEVDILVKSTYSTILTDLGQTLAIPNILTDTTLLAYFTSNLSNIEMANFKPGPADASYDLLESSTGRLGTTPSVISTTYTCQVPELKSAGNLIVAIVVADLVLLQVVWQLYKLLAETYLSRQQITANHCQGCLSIPGHKNIGDPSISKISRSRGDPIYLPLVNVSNPEI